ncbi:MAG: TIR domain-containing protein [Opitutaceae bacterium]|nr:TIR domain-containing protein [Opitutaceae bacterium]
MNAPAPKYWAFISYSHRDARVATALQHALETYRLPKNLVGQRTATGEVPARLKPIFLDRHELQAGTDLKTIVGEALARSRFLIVVCSPDSARSPWVEQEIIEFKKLHGESRVLAVIARGEPFASRMPGREAEECFPLPLRAEVTVSGFADGPPLEPIAADLRPHADGRRRGTLKLIAGIVGVGADELLRRDAKRRMRQLAIVAAGSLAGMAAMGVLALNAVHSRNDAQVQRAEAEDLLEFMLGDLRKKLDAVGRLDVLDGVGEKALDYYARQEADQMDPNSLGRRSRALHLIGEMREQRGQLDLAQVAFQRAADTTAQLLARAPNDAQRIFDHAQSVYWVGHLARLRGQLTAAEREFRVYMRLADQLVRLEAGKLEWQVEAAFARGNLGVICLDTSRAHEALEILMEQLGMWRRIILTRPSYALSVGNCLGWIAKAHEAAGNLEQALETQKEKMRVLEAMPDASTNQQVKRSVRVIYNELARLLLALGRSTEARSFAVIGVQSSKALAAIDPQNQTWREQQYVSQLIMAETQLAAGDMAGARENIEEARIGTTRLLVLNPKVAKWQVSLPGSVLSLSAELAREDDRSALIAALIEYLANVRPYVAPSEGANRSNDVSIGRAESQLALLLEREGRAEEAAAHWRAVVARLQPYAPTNDFPALILLASAQLRLGSFSDAHALAQRIEASPYRHPAYADLVKLLTDRAELSAAKP